MTSPSASSRKASLSKIASNRLQKELVEWQVNPPTGFKHKVTDNLQRWIIEVNGAPGTLYAGETFQLQVDFPEHYPMEAPQVNFSNDLKFFSLTLWCKRYYFCIYRVFIGFELY
ncbi:probable ubiquitin-conjugating enzyme E2 18 [Olea europaea subsp. europaea]|uniref:Probable ubiquitin-conjugating enzyme E2 18 n=1 Tax=Olea europaea subsp. europaea TaxID=158383 RepID=A0A8S0SCQ6_OLEEU|nr:probable ubiquitin-conjugating enzyme E2 18 [Olea europaea subsp. europaea]